jgi:hypothetical protein
MRGRGGKELGGSGGREISILRGILRFFGILVGFGRGNKIGNQRGEKGDWRKGTKYIIWEYIFGKEAHDRGAVGSKVRGDDQGKRQCGRKSITHLKIISSPQITLYIDVPRNVVLSQSPKEATELASGNFAHFNKIEYPQILNRNRERSKESRKHNSHVVATKLSNREKRSGDRDLRFRHE